MGKPIEAQMPSPELFFDTVNAYQRTAALKAAIELDIFTAIAAGEDTPQALAARCGAAVRGARTLCDYLVVLGFLTKEGGRYGLTDDSAVFLSRASSAYLGGAIKFLLSPMLTDAFTDLAAGIAFAKEYPEAEIVALDWPNVLEVAVENAKAEGIGARYKTIAGSAFDADFGNDYEVVLLTNFLHHFDKPTCERLLRKTHAALRKAGRAITLEFVPNEDRVSPPRAASFSLMMLGTTPSGDAYTFREYEEMFRNAGFKSSEMHSLGGGFQQVVISYK